MTEPVFLAAAPSLGSHRPLDRSPHGHLLLSNHTGALCSPFLWGVLTCPKQIPSCEGSFHLPPITATYCYPWSRCTQDGTVTPASFSGHAPLYGAEQPPQFCHKCHQKGKCSGKSGDLEGRGGDRGGACRARRKEKENAGGGKGKAHRATSPGP